MTWTVTQKLGANASRSFELSKGLSNISFFGKEMACGLFLLCAAVYGRHVGASWVFQVYFATQAHCTQFPSPSLPPRPAIVARSDPHADSANRRAGAALWRRALFLSSSRSPWCSSST